MEKEKFTNKNKQTTNQKNNNFGNKHGNSNNKNYTDKKPNISTDTLTPLSGGTNFMSAVFAPEFRSVVEGKISNALYKTAQTGEKIGTSASQAVKSTAIMLTQQTGDSGRGFKTAMDVANVAGISASVVMGSVNRKSEKMTLRREGIDGVKGTNAKLAELDKNLKKCGLDGIPKDKSGNYIKGDKLQRYLKRQKVKAGGLVNKQASEAVKTYLKQGNFIAKNTKYLSGKGNLRKTRKLGKRYARRAIMGAGDSGRGLQQTIMFTGAAKKALKANIKVAKMGTRATRFATKKTLKASLKLATKISYSEKISNTKLGKGLSKIADKGNKAEKYVKTRKQTKGNLKQQKKDRRKATRNKVKNKIKGKIKRGSSSLYNKTIGKTRVGNLLSKSRKKMLNVKYKIKGSKAGKIINQITSRVFSIFRTVTAPVRFLKRLFKKLVGLIIGVVALVLIFYLLMMVIAASLGLTIGDTESNTSVARDTLNQLYKEDLEWIQTQGENYSKVEVLWKDIKDYDLYNKKKKEGNVKDDFSFSQSSNCAEILSMAQVHFDYALDNADQDEVKDYVTKLYYGSHRPVITEYTYTQKVKDKNGKMKEENCTGATITMETTYFPKLFDCKLLSESQNDSAACQTSADLLISTTDDIYVSLRNSGLSHAATCGIMGNIQAESSFNPLAGNENSYFGIVQWGGGRLVALKKYCSDNKKDYKSLSAQLEFFLQEFGSGSYNSNCRKVIKNSNDVDECTARFCAVVEGCYSDANVHPELGFNNPNCYYKYGGHEYWQHLDRRKNYAKDFDNKYKKYKDDWSKLVNNGKKMADYAVSFAEKIHYTQGRSGYKGSRYVGPDLSSITTDKVGRNKGTDCSGFVASVYMHFGISTPQSTSGYSSYSSKVVDVKDIQPGDVLWINHHVEMYIGNGQTMGLHDQYCVIEGTGKCNKDSNISQNGLEWFKKHSELKVYRFWK